MDPLPLSNLLPDSDLFNSLSNLNKISISETKSSVTTGKDLNSMVSLVFETIIANTSGITDYEMIKMKKKGKEILQAAIEGKVAYYQSARCGKIRLFFSKHFGAIKNAEKLHNKYQSHLTKKFDKCIKPNEKLNILLADKSGVGEIKLTIEKKEKILNKLKENLKILNENKNEEYFKSRGIDEKIKGVEGQIKDLESFIEQDKLKEELDKCLASLRVLRLRLLNKSELSLDGKQKLLKDLKQILQELKSKSSEGFELDELIKSNIDELIKSNIKDVEDDIKNLETSINLDFLMEAQKNRKTQLKKAFTESIASIGLLQTRLMEKSKLPLTEKQDILKNLQDNLKILKQCQKVKSDETKLSGGLILDKIHEVENSIKSLESNIERDVKLKNQIKALTELLEICKTIKIDSARLAEIKDTINKFNEMDVSENDPEIVKGMKDVCSQLEALLIELIKN